MMAKRAISAALISLLCLLFCRAANAQDDIAARVEWYGVYTVSKSEEIKDPASPTGLRYTSTPVPPTVNSERVPGRDGVRFGLSYVLIGRAKGDVTVKEVYRFPPPGMPDAATGAKVANFQQVKRRVLGVSRLMGWSFQDSKPGEIVLGEWSFEVWVGDKKLVEKRFTVYPP